MVESRPPVCSGRPFLAGRRLTGRVRQARGCDQQVLVHFVADTREVQQVVASVVGEDVEGDGLQEVAALVDFADVLVAQPGAVMDGLVLLLGITGAAGPVAGPADGCWTTSDLQKSTRLLLFPHLVPMCEKDLPLWHLRSLAYSTKTIPY